MCACWVWCGSCELSPNITRAMRFTGFLLSARTEISGHPCSEPPTAQIELLEFVCDILTRNTD